MLKESLVLIGLWNLVESIRGVDSDEDTLTLDIDCLEPSDGLLYPPSCGVFLKWGVIDSAYWSRDQEIVLLTPHDMVTATELTHQCFRIINEILVVWLKGLDYFARSEDDGNKPRS